MDYPINLWITDKQTFKARIKKWFGWRSGKSFSIIFEASSLEVASFTLNYVQINSFMYALLFIIDDYIVCVFILK